MKLSHRDFRPPRRSKYVTRPPKRRPTLRVLLLGLFGLAVYLKFDAVARLSFWPTLRHPGEWLSARMHPRNAAPAPAPVVLLWEPDSSSVKADCPAEASVCLGPGFPLGTETAGQVRELLGKAEAQWQAEARDGFSAAFARERDPVAADSGWVLTRLEIRGAHPLVLGKDPERGANAFCAAGRCLDEIHPRSPLAAFRSVQEHAWPVSSSDPGLAAPAWPAASFEAESGAGVLPVLRGRVVAVPSPGDTAHWLKLHHGRNLFSYYRGLARTASSVRAGAMLEAGDTLGWIGGDSGQLDLRIESEGAAVDPLAFLGLPARTGEAAHGR